MDDLSRRMVGGVSVSEKFKMNFCSRCGCTPEIYLSTGCTAEPCPMASSVVSETRETNNAPLDIPLNEALEDDMGKPRLPEAVRDAVYWLNAGGRSLVADALAIWAGSAEAPDLEQKLDAVAKALDYPSAAWRIAGCDTLAHAITDLVVNFSRLQAQIAKIDATLDELHAPVKGKWEGAYTKLSRRGRIKALQSSVAEKTAGWMLDQLIERAKLAEQLNGGAWAVMVPWLEEHRALIGAPVSLAAETTGGTPRTDYAATLIQFAVAGKEQYDVVTAEFARELERDLQHQQALRRELSQSLETRASQSATTEKIGVYVPSTGSCRGECDCVAGEACKAYLVYIEKNRADSGNHLEKP